MTLASPMPMTIRNVSVRMSGPPGQVDTPEVACLLDCETDDPYEGSVDPKRRADHRLRTVADRLRTRFAAARLRYPETASLACHSGRANHPARPCHSWLAEALNRHCRQRPGIIRAPTGRGGPTGSATPTSRSRGAGRRRRSTRSGPGPTRQAARGLLGLAANPGFSRGTSTSVEGCKQDVSWMSGQSRGSSRRAVPRSRPPRTGSASTSRTL